MGGKKTTIENTIFLNGEKEYRKALTQINQGLKESKAAMRAAAAEYDASGGSMESLQQQGDALERTIKGQTDALALMGEHLLKVEEHYGKNSYEAAQLRTRINNMRTELAKTQVTLREFERGLESGENAMKDAGDAGQKAEQGIAQIGKGAQDAGEDVDGLIDKLGELAGSKIGSLVTGAAIGAGVGAAWDAGAEQTRSEGQLAAYTGATGEQLEALQGVAESVYKEGFGESLMDAARNVGIVTTYTGAMGDALEKATGIAYRLDDVFGMDIPESARTARQMMEIFRMDAQSAYALIASGAQEGADKNGNLLDSINEYAPYYQKAGKSAEEFIGTLAAGAQSGVYDVDKIGDAMKTFTENIGDGSQATTDALKMLGIEAADLPGKFALGGETASAAFDLAVAAIAKLKDPLDRQAAGITLFGQAWTDTGGAILEIFGAIASNAQETQGVLDSLFEGRDEDVGVQLDRLKRRAELAAGEMFEPITKGAARALGEINEGLDSGDLLGGVMDAAIAWGDGLHEAIDPTLEKMRTAIVEELHSSAEEINEAATETGEAFQPIVEGAEDAVNALVEGVDSGNMLGGFMDATVEMVGGMYEAADRTVGEIFSAVVKAFDVQALSVQRTAEQVRSEIWVLEEEIARAFAGGDTMRVWSLETQKQALLEEIARIEEEAMAAMEEAGEETASALEDTKGDMEGAAQEVADTAVSEIEGAERDMESAGEMIGESAVSGAEDGLSGMNAAGQNAAASLVAGIRSGESAAYNAGASLGGAVKRGYQEKMMINSPSRVMIEEGHFTTAGLFEALDEDGEELRRRAAGLAQAVEEGYSSGGGLTPSAGDTAAMEGIDYERLGAAVADAIGSMTLGMDARKAGGMLELYISQAERNRAGGTVSGSAIKVKGW